MTNFTLQCYLMGILHFFGSSKLNLNLLDTAQNLLRDQTVLGHSFFQSSMPYLTSLSDNRTGNGPLFFIIFIHNIVFNCCWQLKFNFFVYLSNYIIWFFNCQQQFYETILWMKMIEKRGPLSVRLSLEEVRYGIELWKNEWQRTVLSLKIFWAVALKLFFQRERFLAIYSILNYKYYNPRIYLCRAWFYFK